MDIWISQAQFFNQFFVNFCILLMKMMLLDEIQTMELEKNYFNIHKQNHIQNYVLWIIRVPSSMSAKGFRNSFKVHFEPDFMLQKVPFNCIPPSTPGRRFSSRKGPLYGASRESRVGIATLKEPVTQNRRERNF